LNFQSCGALVNFDMPWNPMRVEQRIGRVDRLGQQFERIAIVNLLYEGTFETDIYRVLRDRISLFTSVVGKLQPILSAMPTRLAEATLAPPAQREQARANIFVALRRDIEDAQAQAFDLDEVVDAVLDADPGPPPAYDLDTLTACSTTRSCCLDGVEAKRNGSHEVFWTEPGRAQVAVATDAEYFEDNADSLELWSPGGGFRRRLRREAHFPWRRHSTTCSARKISDRARPASFCGARSRGSLQPFQHPARPPVP
jgi:hypothetical protein